MLSKYTASHLLWEYTNSRAHARQDVSSLVETSQVGGGAPDMTALGSQEQTKHGVPPRVVPGSVTAFHHHHAVNIIIIWIVRAFDHSVPVLEACSSVVRCFLNAFAMLHLAGARSRAGRDVSRC